MKKTNFLYIATTFAACYALFSAFSFLIQTTRPSADVIARIEDQTFRVRVDEFEPGDVRVLRFDNLPIVVWRRNDEDKALAASQDRPELWRVQHSNIFGHAEPVFASDENLTLNGEWFLAVATSHDGPLSIPLTRTGDFHGFFDSRMAGHYDLAGRIRRGGYKNLTVIKAELSEDKQTIQLDLRQKPTPSR